ncbi:MAG: DUF1810 domain-containing protein [Symploca sp. SIO2D2]|nr:DUF1810 domain-containing protein [Symploca sp. SIO2D2]
MSDIYNLQRFVDAQQSIYEQVLYELELGRKNSYWIWYIFPQIQGLGRSWTAEKFAISSLEEAKAYLKHPLLGTRLRQCTQLVLNIEGRDIEEIFDYPDYLKFCSSMTLFFSATTDNRIFEDALVKYFAGEPDQLTLDILGNL